MSSDYRKWLAVGTGVGIEIGSTNLDVTIARVRPRGIAVIGSAAVPSFRTRPAVEWGSELIAFLKSVGVSHIPATVLLPRKDVIVRQINFPGITDKDLGAAIQLQIDGLHPFPEDEAVFAYSRLGNTPAVLIGITRRDVIESYTNLFAEAGVKVASLTFSAAVLHSAVRILARPPVEGFIGIHTEGDDVEVYGESEARPVFSATLPTNSEAALARAAAELRLPATGDVISIEEFLAKPVIFPEDHDPANGGLAAHAFPYATAVAGACNWLGAPVNLLPAERRQSSSRLRLIPTFVLGAALLLTLTALAGYSSYENAQYVSRLQGQIRKLEPTAMKVAVLDKQIAATRARTLLLDDFRKRSKADLDAINELTRLVPPPGWVNNLDIRRSTVQFSGEVEQAADLVKRIDNSPLFEHSEFTMSPSRVAGGEVFSIKTAREGAPKESSSR